MPQKKTKSLILLSLFLVAFYASSTGYADKSFVNKEKAPEPIKNEVTPKEMKVTPSEVPAPPSQEAKVPEPVNTPAVEADEPNHPKRYER